MTTPFHKLVELLKIDRYHNHRLEQHSDVVSNGIFSDLIDTCPALRGDYEAGIVNAWSNVSAPGDRLRKVDLFVGEPNEHGGPDVTRVRIAVENKSVITAHRNRTNRFDDLRKVLAAIHEAAPEALVVATVLVGLAERVLNVPDQLAKHFRSDEGHFKRSILPRLSSGDQRLWKEFEFAVSYNSTNDPQKTVDLFKTLPVRPAGFTHVEGYDAVLLVPVMIDNVSMPYVPEPNPLGIDVGVAYQSLLKRMCSAYTARWHT